MYKQEIEQSFIVFLCPAFTLFYKFYGFFFFFKGGVANPITPPPPIHFGSANGFHSQILEKLNCNFDYQGK